MTRSSKSIKLLSALLALVMVFGLVPAGSLFASALTEGLWTYEISGDEAAITKCDVTAEGEITVPETLGSVPVTGINEHSFSECEKITSVTIPDCVKTVGVCSFEKCAKLVSVKIGAGVQTIGENAFSECGSLEKFEVAAENTAYTSDETGVLYNKEKTELIVYPASNASETFTAADSVITIKDNAFAGSKNLKTVILGDKVTAIGKNAFLGSRNLESIVIGKGVTTIGTDAFEGCNKLISFNVNAANTALCSDENGVLYSKDKTQLIRYPAGSSNKAYVVADETTKINILSFADAASLEEITIGKAVKEIAASAFSGCTALTKVNYAGAATEWNAVTIGANNEKLTGASFIFAGGAEHEHEFNVKTVNTATCTQQGSVFYECECGHSYTETLPATGHNFSDNNCTKCLMKKFVLASDGTKAKITGYNGNATDLVIPSVIDGYTINSIGDGAFDGHSEIVSITIPETVEEIGSCAFYRTGYYNTASNWKNGVLYIGKYLIEADDTVNGSYTISDGTTVIADYAFASRSAVTSVTFPASIKIIGDAAFSNCTGLTEVNCGVMKSEWENVVIGTSNDSLLNATLVFVPDPHTHSYDETVEEVEATCTTAGYRIGRCSCGETERTDYAAPGHIFINNVCSGCEGREYEYSVVSGKVTIEGCHESLSGTVKIPSKIGGYNVVAISAIAFAGNNKISAIEIPQGVTTIGEKAFFNCDELVSVSVPASVVSIGKSAFADCAKLTAVSVDEANMNFSSDAEGALFNEAKTEIIYYPTGKTNAEYEIPAGVVTVGENAFCGNKYLEKITLPKEVRTIKTSAFEGCTEITDVIFGGTETKWNKVVIMENNTVITTAAKTFLDLSDVETALVNAGKLDLVNAEATASGIIIIITAEENVEFIEIRPMTKESDAAVSVKTEGTAITVSEEGNYVLTFVDCHKTGNKAESEITIGSETYIVKFEFPTVDGGHDYSISEKFEPDCDDDGYTRKTCSICCAYKDEDIVPALGHRYNNWIIEVDETCTEQGVKSRVCTVCNHKETGKVLPSGHRYVAFVTEATCLEGGFTEYKCSLCDDSYRDNAVAALGHAYGEWTIITEATCTQAGERVRECSRCAEGTEGHKVQEEIAALGHNYVSVVTPPTYTEYGYTTHTCSVCGDTYEDSYIEPIGEVDSVEIGENITINKDDELMLEPIIVCLGAMKKEDCTVIFESKDESVVKIDENGVITAVGRGKTQIVCTVIDSNGKEVTDICSVEVKFTILQWITWFLVDVLLALFR